MARQNDHNRAEELISAYLDKRVTTEEQNFFERHIASCADCRAQLEATRSMIAALKAMPAVKAPRSFVLPREMAKQPKRSFFSLYPALRLATVMAALAFVVLFAGDLLISQIGGSSAPQTIPAAAPAPAAMQAPAPPVEVAATQEAEVTESPSGAAMAPAEPAAPAAGAAAKASATTVMTESTMAMSAPTATPAATAVADTANQSRMMLSATPASSAAAVVEKQAETAAEQPAAADAVEAAPAPAVDPLRVVEIALLVLVVVLSIATLVARRRQA
jgi:anti-sigma factor RsiW